MSISFVVARFLSFVKDQTGIDDADAMVRVYRPRPTFLLNEKLS